MARESISSDLDVEPAPDRGEANLSMAERLPRGAMGLLLAIAMLDVLLPRVTVAIFFAIPLVMAARQRASSRLAAITACAVGLTFADFFLKVLLFRPATGPQFFDYRLLNRVLVAIMLLSIAALAKMIAGGQGDLRDLPWPEATARDEERSFFLMLLLLGLPVLGLLVLVDSLTPAEFNWPILYGALIVTCALLRSRKALWVSAIVLSVLTLAGYLLAPPSAEAGAYARPLLVNRFLVILVLLVIATIADRSLHRAHWWHGGQ